MFEDFGVYLGPAAGIATSILWTITALFFTAGGKRIGVTAVNAIRIGVGVVLLGITHRVLAGQWIPDALGYQVLLLGLSGIIGLTIGDHALFASFVYIGPRLAMLIMATAPIMATLFGWIALDETFSLLAWLGMILAISGIVWVVRERPDQKTAVDRSHRIWGVVLAIIGAVCQAGGYMLSKQGMGHGWLPPEQHMDPQAAALIRMVCAGIGVIPIVIWHRLRRTPNDITGRPRIRVGSRWTGLVFTLCGGVVGPYLGMWMSLVAVDLTPLGIAQTLCSLPPVLILPFAILVQKERVSPRAAIGAFIAVAGSALLFLTPNSEPPIITLQRDDTVIAQSYRVLIPEGTVIEDTNGNGVIQVTAPNVVIEFAEGSVLCGAPSDTAPDAYEGFGIRINGQSGVVLRGATIRGYRCALWATGADDLTIEGTNASHCRQARLRSTPSAEDTADWLSPHDNDDNEWLGEYGAALYVEDCSNTVIHRCRVHHGQNALCLDAVSHAKVYDNDFSFNSGWGIALWRSCHNTLSRNACDFCIRGYSHGVYNRGQDSAGILLFEQCCNNIIAENSATHCGDGLFAFAGNEALGQATPPSPAFDYTRRGNNDNLIFGNDFSDAAAHGVELTFSFGNRIIDNRIVGNAICGIWGGYSQGTTIAGNRIESNGDAGYGLERGGVNIEHGRANRIVHNTFVNNTCGVHLWWDADEAVAKLPWARANSVASTQNVITDNTFSNHPKVFHFRGDSDVTLGDNTLDPKEDVNEVTDTESCVQVTVNPDLHSPPREVPVVEILGETRPVGKRPDLAGRENIILSEWGPWDHASPLVRMTGNTGDTHTYELFMMPEQPLFHIDGAGVTGHTEPASTEIAPQRYILTAAEPGLHPYILLISAGDDRWEFHNTLVDMHWRVSFFSWSEDTDPRTHSDTWLALAEGDATLRGESKQLHFVFGFGGPANLDIWEAPPSSEVGKDHFGLIARTALPLPGGKWTLRTRSDDGIRVIVDGETLIENWTWHAPTADEGSLTIEADRTVEIVVEYFEIDGYATCEFDILRGEPER